MLLVLLAASCVPLQGVIFGGPASLEYCIPCGDTYGFVFDPSGVLTEAVILDILGDDLASSSPTCDVVGKGLQCLLGDVREPTYIAVTGFDVTATATYRYQDNIYQEVAR